jgi:hypothetical protein
MQSGVQASSWSILTFSGLEPKCHTPQTASWSDWIVCSGRIPLPSSHQYLADYSWFHNDGRFRIVLIYTLCLFVSWSIWTFKASLCA